MYSNHQNIVGGRKETKKRFFQVILGKIHCKNTPLHSTVVERVQSMDTLEHYKPLV